MLPTYAKKIIPTPYKIQICVTKNCYLDSKYRLYLTDNLEQIFSIHD